MSKYVSDFALDMVREYATENMGYTVLIERVTKPTFDQSSGTAVPGSRTTIYSGPGRIWEISGASIVTVGSEDEISMQSVQLTIPWGTTPVPRKWDEVTVIDAARDDYLIGKRFVIDSSAKAGELRATRRFSIRGYQEQ